MPFAANDNFGMETSESILDNFRSITAMMAIAMVAISSVGLMVGGIGVMNIMLVSVTERTREIGVRMALGATRTHILAQFMIEALLLCLVGGIIGILAGAGASWALSSIAGWRTAITTDALVLAFVFSAAVGLVFGLWPARRAALLDPIEALRRE